MKEINIKILFFLNKDLGNPLLDKIANFVTDIEIWRIPLIILWLSLLILGNRKLRLCTLLSGIVLILSYFLSSQLKYLFQVERPFKLFDDIRRVTSDSGYSFPSSHATNLFSVSYVVAHFYKKIHPIFFLFASFISIARVYQGVHYPSDIIAGAILGISIARFVVIFNRRLFKIK